MADHAKKLATILFENKFRDQESFASVISDPMPASGSTQTALFN